jgi:hypothetical protein
MIKVLHLLSTFNRFAILYKVYESKSLSKISRTIIPHLRTDD